MTRNSYFKVIFLLRRRIITWLSIQTERECCTSAERTEPRGIDEIHRIVPNISIEIDLILVSDGIGLEEPAERGRVDAGLVIVHAELGEPDLPGVTEPALGGDVIARGGVGNAVFVVGVGGDAGPGVVRDRNDAPARIGVEDAARRVGLGRAFVPDQRIISLDVRSMDIAAQLCAKDVVLGDKRIAIMQ